MRRCQILDIQLIIGYGWRMVFRVVVLPVFNGMEKIKNYIHTQICTHTLKLYCEYGFTLIDSLIQPVFYIFIHP